MGLSALGCGVTSVWAHQCMGTLVHGHSSAYPHQIGPSKSFFLVMSLSDHLPALCNSHFTYVDKIKHSFDDVSMYWREISDTVLITFILLSVLLTV